MMLVGVGRLKPRDCPDGGGTPRGGQWPAVVTCEGAEATGCLSEVAQLASGRARVSSCISNLKMKLLLVTTETHVRLKDTDFSGWGQKEWTSACA